MGHKMFLNVLQNSTVWFLFCLMWPTSFCIVIWKLSYQEGAVIGRLADLKAFALLHCFI